MATKTHDESESFERALSTFGNAVQLVQEGNFTKAKDMFKEVLGSLKDEPVLAERSRMYLAVCSSAATSAVRDTVTPIKGVSPGDVSSCLRAIFCISTTSVKLAYGNTAR